MNNYFLLQGKILRLALLKEASITQEDIARLTGKDRSLVSLVVNEKANNEQIKRIIFSEVQKKLKDFNLSYDDFWTFPVPPEHREAV
jgi:transcriptional regulator with XRE-family HTH domain